MSVNLLETVQKKMGYPPLQKIDPNTQEVKPDEKNPHDPFGQAAIPTLLITLYKFSRTDEGAEKILRGAFTPDPLDELFGDSKATAIKKVSDYASLPPEETATKMNAIATEAIQQVKETVTPTATVLAVKDFLADQRNNILPYLPASLQLGALLHEDALDDRTNKMEGPVSSLMHAIGGKLAGSDPDEKLNKE